MKKALVALAVLAAFGSIAAGGTGIALGDPTPTFGERVFLMLEGRVGKTWPRIVLRCDQDTVMVMKQAKSSEGGGAWFTLGPTPEWSAGSAICTANLEKQTKSGGWRLLDQIVFRARAA